MTAAVLFVENYIAGGADQVANILIKKLPFSRLTVMVNRADDTRILLAGEVPEYVAVQRYGLVTIPELAPSADKPLGQFWWLFQKALSLLARYPLFLFSIFYFMWRIRRIGASIFIANNGGYPGGFYCRSATIAASLLPGVESFHIVHSMAVPRPRTFAPMEWLIDRLIDRRSRVITVCRAAGECLKAIRGFKQDAEVIYNGLMPEARRCLTLNEAKGLRVLNVGYFDYNKNQVMLLRSIAELVARGKRDVKVVFAGTDTGDGSLERCVNIAKGLGIFENVAFAGFVEDVLPLYAEAELLVSCSYCEGLPMSILEAMRAGRAVVSTNVGGASELVCHGENGYLVAVDDHFALADLLERLYDNRDLLASFGNAGRERYEQLFSLDQMVSRYVSVLGL
ncbi:MAG: glycosyltransferase family 4 protein [Rhodocyclaceae bacterium]|nr:glycosyltransferase family 4 protein [Rhodocyclaceae bacterium]